MHKALPRGFCLLVLSACFILLLPSAKAQERRALQTQVAAPANAQPLGRLAASQRLQLAISLPLRNQDDLDSLLRRLYDPSNPDYRNFLTVQQFAQQYAPSLVDYQRVLGFAQANGLRLVRAFPNRLIVDVSGSAASIEQAFHVKIQVYQHPTEDRTYYAPDVEPTVEEGLPILSVDGLSNFNLPHPRLRRADPNVRVQSNTTGSGQGGQFLGSDMRTAYGGGTALDGTGQVVGLIELGPYRLPDVLSYFSTLGQALKVPIVNVVLSADGVCSQTEPAPGPCDDGEEVIDIQQAISMAPNLSALIIYEAYSSSVQAVDAYNQAASDNIAKSLSISFGWGGTPGSEPSYEQVFKELEAQGQSSFVASGDAGASLSGGYPGSSQNITDAGGTDLTTVSAGGAWQSESGWIGSGGGWNTASPIPTYQTSAIDSSNGGDSQYRNIPDVSAEANTDNYFCANGSCQGGIGGTSLAAPRWAAFVALINQQAAENATASGSNATLGFLNPTIYSLNSANYADSFHDITTGNSATSTSCTPGTLGCLSNGVVGFDAVTGFDLVTGWGSPNGPTVFDALAPKSSNPNFSITATPSVLSLAAGNGGTSSIAITALNGFSAATNLAVVIPGSPNSAPAGLTAQLNSSSIPAGGGPVTLTIGTTSSTPGGTYVIAVVGTSGSLTQTTYVTVELPAFVGLTATPSGGVSLNQGGTAAATVTITGINGFNGTVNLTTGNLPNGVTASVASVNPTTSTITFSASPTAALTGAGKPATVVITGTSGSATQNTGFSLFVNPAASGGTGTAVDLSSAANVHAFYTDADESAITSTNSLDGVGFAFSANLLNSGVDFNGTQFTFGTPNQANAVYGTGSSITLPAGYYTTLQLLATGIEGDQASKTVTVTYSDSTTSTFTQSFSDWCSALNGGGCVSTGSNSGESVAVAMPYRISAGGPDNRVFYLYHYSFTLNSNKQVQSFTLPNTRDVVVLAVTLAGQVTTGFSLAPSPGSFSVPQGGSNTSTITVTSTGGFSSAVNLSASGLPSGVTASFNPVSASTTSALTLAASSTATTGTASVTITGTAGSVTETTTLNVTVTPPVNYSLSAGSSSPGTISPGGSSQATISVKPANGYTGTITLSCSISPAVTPAPTCSFGDSGQVSVTGSAGGTDTMTFSAVGPSAAMVKPATIFALLMPVPAMVLFVACFGSNDSKRRTRTWLFLSLMLMGFIIIPACGGGGGSGGGGGGNGGTPAGTYTITISGKDANGVTQTNTAPTVSVTVN